MKNVFQDSKILISSRDIKMKFETAYNILMALEGGFVNHKYDRGGQTKFGISQRQYPDLDIKNLTKEKAMAITKKDYWDKLCCDNFHFDELQLEMLDYGFVAGTSRCARYLQQALNLIGYDTKVDSIIGPQTVGNTNKATVKYGKSLVAALRGFEFEHFKRLAIKDETQKAFIKGWLARI